MDTFDYIIKKYNINVGRQYVVTLPDMGSADLAALFAELNLNKGAEVGVWTGEYSEVLLKANPNLHLYSIDSWKVSAYDSWDQDNSNPLPGSREQAFFEDCYNQAVKNLSPYNCTIVRKSSMEALKDFPDNSLDFVYLDAGHDFLNFTLDIHYWKNKVRIGGILAGHDYSTFPAYKMIHVKETLMTYARAYRMLPFFALPRIRGKLKRDIYGSWFWVKDKETS